VDDLDRRPPTDPLALAEAVAAGRLSVAAAEAALRAEASDGRRAERSIAEFGDLLAAVRAVRHHADAFRGVSGAAPTPAARPSSMQVTSRPLDRQDVRIRRRPEQRPSRFAPLGALVAAAVVVVGVAAVVVGPRLLPQVAASASPSASTVAVVPPQSPSAPPSPSSPSPAPAVTPHSTSAAPNIPPVANGPLPGAPDAYIWSASDDGTIRIWLWTPGQPLKALMSVGDGIPGSANDVRRTVVAAPDGRAFAIAETMTGSGNGQFRIVNVGGTNRPAVKGRGDWTIVWAADGSRVAYAILPDPWTVATAGADGAWTPHTYEPTDEPAALFAFSADGASLYGYKTQVEADFWERPIRLNLKTGAYTDLKAFPGGDVGIAITNGTTKADQVNPATGRVVDSGSALGGGWETRVGAKATPLAPGLSPAGDAAAEGQPIVWGPDELLVIDRTSAGSSGRPSGVTLAIAGPFDDAATVAFRLAGGTYRAGLLGVRNGYALLGIGADAGQTTTDGQPYWDEAVMIDTADGSTAVLVPDDSNARQVHLAGWGLLPGAAK
jgi:hypothetical protein